MRDRTYTQRLLTTAVLAAVVMFAGVAIARAQMELITLVGEINDTSQLVSDGRIYDIAETPEGDDLIANYISIKVKVTGYLQKGSEVDIISVRSFEVVGE